MNSIARILAAALLVVVIAACSPADNSSAPPAPPTPPDPGIAEALFDAMRQGREQTDLVFVTTDLKIDGDWAWVTADPQSKDGTQHYETESWLLHKEAGTWRVVAQPCAEEGCEPKAELAKMRERFPEAPAGIFPGW